MLNMTDEELDKFQLSLAAAGMTPGVGNLADLTDAGISLARGDLLGAVLAGLSAIPILGMAAGGANASRRAARAAKAAKDAIPKQISASKDVQEFLLDKFREGSKVVDKSGNPLPVYRGLDADYGPEFRVAGEGALGAGIYTTPNPEFASEYAKGEGGNVSKLWASIKNPLEIHASRNRYEDPMVAALKQLGMPEERAFNLVEKAYETKGYVGKQVMNKAKAQGYDGIIQYGKDGEIREVVPFLKTQLKSATGNRGTYDPTDPNIMKALLPAAVGAGLMGKSMSDGSFSEFVGEDYR
jgi:hypothetical protein